MADDAGSLDRGRFRYFAVAPARMEFAIEVRQALLNARPEVVAIELPAPLQPACLQAVRRLPEMSVLLYPGGEDQEQAIYVPVEPADPFTEAIRTAIEIGAEILFADPGIGERPHLPDLYPDTYSIRHIGIDRYVEAYRVYPQPRSDEISRHASGIAWKLQGADPMARVFCVISLNLLDPVLDAMEEPQSEPNAKPRPPAVEVYNLHPDCLAEVTLEYPFLQDRYEHFRVLMNAPDPIDRRLAQLALFRQAEAAYESNTGEKVAHWQRRLLSRFTRNLALTGGQLAAGLFDIAVAARSVVDDNFAWDVWDTANRYPTQKAESDVPTLNISGEEVWIDTRKIRLRRRLPSSKRRFRPAGLKAALARPGGKTGDAVIREPGGGVVAVGQGRDNNLAVLVGRGDGQAYVRVATGRVSVEGDDRRHRMEGQDIVELAR